MILEAALDNLVTDKPSGMHRCQFQHQFVSILNCTLILALWIFIGLILMRWHRIYIYKYIWIVFLIGFWHNSVAWSERAGQLTAGGIAPVLEVVNSIPAGSPIIYRFLCGFICVFLCQHIKIKPTNMHVYVYAYAYVCICICICICVCLCICMCMCLCIRIYVYIMPIDVCIARREGSEFHCHDNLWYSHHWHFAFPNSCTDFPC